MDELAQLKEREKELNCLYRVQETLFQRERPLSDVLESIVEFIGEGWQRPESTSAAIEYFGRTYQAASFHAQAPKLVEPLRLGGVEVGHISVSDSSAVATEKALGVFLPEERRLLRSIANFISEFLDRRQLNILGGKLTADAGSHWRWREGIVQSLVDQFDAHKFGPAEFYLSGSTERGDAGHGSDIDISVYHGGSKGQRTQLEMWLTGWSMAVGEMARVQTGEVFPDGILDIQWLQDRPSRLDVQVRKLNPSSSCASPFEVLTGLNEPSQDAGELVQRTLLGLSHELRTPLMVLSTDLDLLKKDIPKQDLDEIIEEMQIAVSRMSILVTDLSLFLRTETSATKAALEEIDLKAFSNSFRSIFLANHPEDERVVFAVEEGLTVFLNLKMMTRAVKEILENAILYSKANTIIVSGGTLEDGRVYLSIKDDGVGIEKRHHDMLFEQFYRIDESRNRAFGGAGLGLPLARALVRGEDAEIELISQQGQGTEVRIVFSRISPKNS